MTDDRRYALMQKNHKVAYVKFVETTDTYDMTTDFGNFATDRIVVSNSFDALKYGALRILDSIKDVFPVKKGWRDRVLGSKLATKSMAISEYWESQEKSMTRPRKTWRN